MPLQNRVDPFGGIHADPARGTLTGNRGIIHDALSRTLLRRRWTTKAWISCRLDFKGRRRDVMGPGSWTALFFLDEATALASGHRPCFFCRREAALAFRAAWAKGNHVDIPRVAEMDAVLHRERLAAGGAPRPIAASDLGALPDGAMVESGGHAFLICQGVARQWHFAGYNQSVPLHALAALPLTLVTPPSIVAALASGYRPQSLPPS